MKRERNWARAIGKLGGAAQEVLDTFHGKPLSVTESQSLKRLETALNRLERIGEADVARVMSQDEITQRREDLVLAIMRGDDTAIDMLLSSLIPVDHYELNIALAGTLAGILLAKAEQEGVDPVALATAYLHQR